MVGFKLQVCDFNRRKKQRRNGNLYIHLYMYLNIYSQSITFRHAHLAAAVSGNL